MLKRVIVGSGGRAAGLVAAAPAGAAGPTDGACRPASTPRRRSRRWCRRRLTRIDSALERLTEDVNEVDGVHAPKAGKVVRRQLAAAWRGARYYITHAPPPPAEDARAGEPAPGRPRARSRAARCAPRSCRTTKGP